MLHTVTLLIVLIVSNLLMAGALWITFAGRFKDGLGQWTRGLLAQGVAWVLVATRNDLTDFVAIALATALLVYCWSLQVSALLEFHHLETPRWLSYGPVVIAFLVVVIYVQDPRVRLALCGLAFGVAEFATGAGLLYYQVSAERRTRLLLAGSFFLMAAGLVWLAFTAWFEPEVILPTSGPRPAPGASLLAFYAVTIASSLAFLLMHKERADNEARELATTDPLTGIYNRRTFQEIAESHLSRARRERDAVSLLILDIDHFKAVNDTHGHLTGDRVLARFATLIRACLRKEDLFGRYGGEEFVVLLPGAVQSAATTLAERVRRHIEKTPLLPNEQCITVSIGISTEIGGYPLSLEAMLGRADKALYNAKAQGRNCVVALPVSVPLQPVEARA